MDGRVVQSANSSRHCRSKETSSHSVKMNKDITSMHDSKSHGFTQKSVKKEDNDMISITTSDQVMSPVHVKAFRIDDEYPLNVHEALLPFKDNPPKLKTVNWRIEILKHRYKLMSEELGLKKGVQEELSKREVIRVALPWMDRHNWSMVDDIQHAVYRQCQTILGKMENKGAVTIDPEIPMIKKESDEPTSGQIVMKNIWSQNINGHSLINPDKIDEEIDFDDYTLDCTLGEGEDSNEAHLFATNIHYCTVSSQLYLY